VITEGIGRVHILKARRREFQIAEAAITETAGSKRSVNIQDGEQIGI